MQRQASFVKPIFLTFIIVGLLFSFAFAQGDKPKDRQKGEAFQMLNLLEGKDIRRVEGDELDFLLDELAEDNGFSPLGLDKVEVRDDREEPLREERKISAPREVLKRNRNSTEEEPSSIQSEVEELHQENIFLEKELARANQKNATMKEKEVYLRKKLTTGQRHLSREAAAQLYEDLGVAYTQAKVYAQAIEAYTTALKLDPRNPKAHHDLGLLYEHFLGDSNKAIYHLSQYLKLDPNPKDRERVARLIEIIKKKDIRDEMMR